MNHGISLVRLEDDNILVFAKSANRLFLLFGQV